MAAAGWLRACGFGCAAAAAAASWLRLCWSIAVAGGSVAVVARLSSAASLQLHDCAATAALPAAIHTMMTAVTGCCYACAYAQHMCQLMRVGV